MFVTSADLLATAVISSDSESLPCTTFPMDPESPFDPDVWGNEGLPEPVEVDHRALIDKVRAKVVNQSVIRC